MNGGGLPADHITQVIFPNFVNGIILSRPIASLGNSLNAASLRMGWYARPGDTIILPTKMPQAFWCYVSSLMEIRPESVEIIEAPSDGLTELSRAVDDHRLMGRIRQVLRRSSDVKLLPYALDESALQFSATIGAGISPYQGRVPPGALDVARGLNAKNGYREVADRLRIPMADGVVCESWEELEEAVVDVVARTGGAVVKPTRSCLGHGLTFVTRRDLRSRPNLLAEYRDGSHHPDGWVVEEKVAFTEVVTAEMVVEADGPRVAHLGEMRTPGGIFSGQVTPMRRSSTHAPQLEAIALRLGDYLAESGYRGPFDIDGGISPDGHLLTTECNIRQTGTTYADFIIRHFFGPEASGMSWILGAEKGLAVDFAAGLDRLVDAGIAWRPGDEEGVILVNDTLAYDRTWRYLVVARSDHRADEIESAVARTLKFTSAISRK
ncbi:peptide ligase PGM1-related protein [Frankia sp. R43]|uniref:preATP grasp domain-containing protein n=1 Tax=Frankia sp. R43 TaxID=269536 RepID=UPI000A5A3EA6|nr:peptide ligase PGM1-related protein [Frankia sp. R43]